MIFLNVYVNVITSFLNIFFLQNFLHVFQLRNYNAKRYLSYFNFKYWIFYTFLIAIFVVQILIFNLFFTIISNIILLFISPLIYQKICLNKKTPLIYTGRLKKIYLLASIFIILPIFFKKMLILSHICMIFAPIFANCLNFYDKLLNHKFIKKAQIKLKNSRAKVIAITGSNGKTTVKNILYEMLKTQFKVIASPQSFNTPIGIAKFLNNSNLNVDFIILEYGARHKNDIKNLCKIFGANYGILTQISPQHLQTFKNIKNIAKAKGKLSEFLNFKPCIFNTDNRFLFDMYINKPGVKFSTSIENENADFYANKITIKNFKTSFVFNHKNNKFNCQTKLLGKHNVTDIMLASALAINLGISIENIKFAISNLKPIPHRLEYLKGAINILDDSYNCSLTSAKEAVEVLSFCENKKMIVTPGIIEAGKNQFEINFQLGELISKSDMIVIVGKTNKQALTKGIISANPTKKILFANTLDDAKQYFRLLNQNDTLLLLNDLPDDYI